MTTYLSRQLAARRLRWLFLGLLSVCLAPVEAAPLEDIVVTARKREENLQDVPIAITAISGDQMRQNNIGTLENLAPQIPNLSYSEAVSGSDQFTIRGLGSGINGGFEQAVGIVVDGVYYGRTRFGRANFLDLERLEVLRGPQGALIGKNTTAGAINITTAKPTQEFEAYIKPLYEFEGSEGFNAEGAISGPLVKGVSARLAMRYDERDGYVENVQNGDDEQALEDLTIRGTLLWEPADSFDAKLSYQYGNNERDGRTRQLSLCGAAFRNFDPDGPGPAPPGALFQQAIAQGEDCNANKSRPTINVQNGSPVDEEFNIDFDIWNLNANWDVGWATLTSVSGYTEYDADENPDLDSIPAEIGSFTWEEDFEQFYQEIRATSTGDRFDWIAGILYMDIEQKTDFIRNFAALPPPLTPSSNRIFTEQDTETWAVFAEFVWHINDQWDLTLGGRYTDEEKDADQLQTPLLLYTNTPTTLPPGGPAFRAHNISDNRSEDDFSPQVTIQWRPTDATMAYASFRQGFKGGGYDAQLDATQAEAGAKFEFDDETVDAFEIGLKTALLDNRLLLNLAAFYSEFDDLQVSTIDSASATFNVGNAAEAISTGVEAEATWAPTDQLTINAALAYLDAEYDDFPGAPCDATQTLAGTCPNDPQPGQQNLEDKELPFAPEWSGTLSAEYVFPVTSNLEASLYGLLTYSDDYATVTDLDPNTFQDDYVKVDVRLGLGNQEGSWDVALIGRNIFDEDTTNFCNDAQGGPFFLGSYFCFVDPPDSWALQATLRF